MKLFLLIIIAVMVLVTMVCSIITTIIIVKDKKAGDLVKKVLTITCIALAIILVIGAAFGVSKMEKNESSNSTSDTSETLSPEDAGFNEVTLDEYLELINRSEKSIILVARPTCSYCELFTPILKQAMEDMNLTINYINTDDFSDDDWTTFSNSLAYLNSEEWGTPLTLIVQDGEVVAENNGYVELDTIKEFFTNNGFGE